MNNNSDVLLDENIGIEEEAAGPIQPYTFADDVEDLALSLINQYHTHLFDAKIAYLFKNGSWKSKGQIVTGKAMVAPQVWKMISNYNLVIIINRTIWTNLENKGKKALLDHELSRFEIPKKDKLGNIKWSLQEHDLKEFSQVIQRHGICIGDPKKLMNAAGKMDLKALEEATVNSEEISLDYSDDFDDPIDDDEDIDNEAGLREGEVVIQNIFEDEPFSDA